MKSKKSYIPISNYVKLALIMIITLVGVLVFRNAYLNNKLYEENIPLIRNYVISEINANEIYNFVRENAEPIIYICTSSNTNCREFEKEFGPIIKSRGLENKITYLNISDVKKKSTFIKEFNKFYDVKLLGYPSIVIFEEGKVKDILTVKTNDSLDIKLVIDFFDKNSVSLDYYD